MNHDEHKTLQAEMDKIAAATTDLNIAWYSGDMGGVDTSGWSVARLKETGLYREPKAKADPFYEEFGQVARPIQGIRREDLENDVELQNELARQDPRFKKQLDDTRMEQVTIAFTSANGDYLSTERNFQRMIRAIRRTLSTPNVDEDDVIAEAYAEGKWTVENLTAAFKNLLKAGQLDVKQGKAKELSKAERLSVISDIRDNDPEAAILNYINFALAGQAQKDWATPREFMSAYPELTSKAVWFVFSNSHPELSPDELRDFYKSMSRHALPTVRMLETALYSWRENQYLRPAITTQPVKPEIEQPREMTQKELEALSDEELEELRIKAVKEYRRSQWQ